MSKEYKPKMTPKWLYRLEFKDSSCGLWYDGSGKWCFESGIGSIDGCKTKTLPMDYDARYKQDGRDWFSSCSRKEDLMHWYSLEDAKELISKGFVFTRYLATEYHEYDQQTVFIKETALYREQIDIFELFGQKPAEDWGENRKQECPFRKTLDNNLFGCERYEGVITICYGRCSWVVDYPKLKEIQDRKAKKPTEWSDTYELVFKDICKHLKEEGYNGWIEILEALHNKESKQPIAEWSKEDEKQYQSVLNGLRYAHSELTYHNSTDSAKQVEKAFAWFENRIKFLLLQSKLKLNESSKADLEKEIHDYMHELGERNSDASILRDKPGYMCIVKKVACHFVEWERKRILDKVVEWMKKNLTYVHPRKGVETCMVNIPAFLDAMNEENT